MGVINKIMPAYPTISKKHTQAFLGIVGFWRIHIPNDCQIASSLYEVTQKNNNFTWGSEQQQAFKQIKQVTVHAAARRPVWTGQDVKNIHNSQGEPTFLEALAESIRGALRSVARNLESGTQRI